MIRSCYHIPEPDRKALSEWAERKDLTASELVRRAVAAYLQQLAREAANDTDR